MKWELIEYIRPNGKVPIKDYLDSLEPKHWSKVIRDLELLQEHGPQLGMPRVRPLGDGIYELRTSFGSNIFRNVFFHWHNNKLVLTHGFTKKGQKIPPSEIKRAKEYRKDFLNRNGGM